MASSLSKIKQLLLLIILFNISSSEFLNKNNLIYSPLFNHENFARVYKVFYQNEKKDSNLIFLSEDSVSSVNIAKKETNYRKKINRYTEIVNLEPKNFFLSQRNSNTVEVYRTETGQFVNSLEILPQNDYLFRVETIKIKEFTMTIFASYKSLTIQSKKKIIFEKNFAKEDANEENKPKNVNLIFDLYIDEEEKCFFYCSLVYGKLKVHKITFDSIHKAIVAKNKAEEEETEDDNEESEEDGEKKEKTKKKKKVQENVEVEEKEIFSKEAVASNLRIVRGILTKDFLYIYNGRGISGYNLQTDKMEVFGLNEKHITYNLWGFYKDNALLVRGDKNFFYFHNGQIHFTYETKDHISCSISNKPSRKLYCYLEDNTSEHNLVAYYPSQTKEGKLDREFYTIDSLLKIYSDSNNLERVNLISVSPYNDKLFTILTTNKIKEYMINSDKKVELIAEMDNNYGLYILSELVVYHKKDESNSDDVLDSYVQYQNYYTTLNSLKGNINLLQILKNLSKIILDDIKEIVKSIQKAIINISKIVNNIINKRAFDLDQETHTKENSLFLFLVTENNLLKIIDAHTGKLLNLQQFPRHQRITILKDKAHINQRYVTILLGRKPFVVYDLQDNRFVNDNVSNKLNYEDEVLINSEQLNMIMKSFLSLAKEKPIYDLRKYKLDEKLFGPKKERIAIYLDYYKSILYILKFYINKNNEQKLIILHNFNFGRILAIRNPRLSEDISQHYLSEGKIFYKLINNDLYYILSSEQKVSTKNDKENTDKEKTTTIKERLVLTILDGKNGKILTEKVMENLEISSVRYLFEENWGLISYIKNNKGFKRNEILSFELMNKNVDYNLLRLFKNKLLNPKNKTVSNDNDEIEIIIKTYVIESTIKGLAMSKSRYNKGNKFILMIFDNNDLQLIKREELSPRRPKMIMIKGKPTYDTEGNTIYSDKELPGYTPIVKLDPNNRFVNKDKNNVFDIKTIEGESESSFITCIIGENLDCSIMYPDKLYDTLSPEFKKEMLLAVTLGFVVFIFFFRKYFVKKEFKKVFLEEK